MIYKFEVSDHTISAKTDYKKTNENSITYKRVGNRKMSVFLDFSEYS